MDIVETSGVEYEIYPKEEADEEGISYTYWKDVDQEGEWALTDDGWVCKVRYIYDCKNGSRNIVLAGGRAWLSENAEINYEEYKEVGNFLYSKPQTHMERELKRSRLKRAVDFYAQQVVNGVAHKDMPWDLIGQIYRPDQQRPEWTARKLFNIKEVMAEANKRVIELMDEEGLTERQLIQDYKKLKEMAMQEGDLTNFRLTLDSISKKRGTDKPQQKERLLEESVSMSREIGEGIQKERQQIEARRKSRTQEDEDE